jgi:hypothetical protein
MTSALKDDLIANTRNILRLEMTKILRFWLKKFGESHPRIYFRIKYKSIQLKNLKKDLQKTLLYRKNTLSYLCSLL